MKTKSILLGAVFFLLVLTACDSLRKPENFTVEIRDAYCYQIAKAMYFVEEELPLGIDYPFRIDFSDSRSERFFEDVEDHARRQMDENIFEDAPYKRALQEMAGLDRRASVVLRYYHSVPTCFNDFVRMSDELDFYVWRTTETNSGIPVKFMLNSEAYYEVEIEDEDAVTWALKLCEGGEL